MGSTFCQNILTFLAGAVSALILYYGFSAVNSQIAIQKVAPRIAGLSPSVDPVPSIQFHLVITSCGRNMWGRFVSTLLLSAWFHDAKPRSVTLVWCQHQKDVNESEVPALLYNLRNSANFKVVYVPDSLVPHPLATYYTAFLVPGIRNEPDLPLIIVEDDVMFAPNFNEQLSWAVKDIADITSKPYFLSLYSPGGTEPADVILEQLKHSQKQITPFQLRHGRTAFVWAYGAQAMFFSADMTVLMKDYFGAVVNGSQQFVGLQDMLMYQFIYKEANCTTDGATCELFATRPSLIEHLGTSSALFGHNNSRFHMSVDFNMKVGFPGVDSQALW